MPPMRAVVNEEAHVSRKAQRLIDAARQRLRAQKRDEHQRQHKHCRGGRLARGRWFYIFGAPMKRGREGQAKSALFILAFVLPFIVIVVGCFIIITIGGGRSDQLRTKVARGLIGCSFGRSDPQSFWGLSFYLFIYGQNIYLVCILWTNLLRGGEFLASYGWRTIRQINYFMDKYSIVSI